MTKSAIISHCGKYRYRLDRMVSDSGPVYAFFGVGQPGNHTARPSRALIDTFSHSAPSFQSLVVGVGRPVQPLSDVRCAEARSAGIDCPAGVAQIGRAHV